MLFFGRACVTEAFLYCAVLAVPPGRFAGLARGSPVRFLRLRSCTYVLLLDAQGGARTGFPEHLRCLEWGGIGVACAGLGAALLQVPPVRSGFGAAEAVVRAASLGVHGLLYLSHRHLVLIRLIRCMLGLMAWSRRACTRAACWTFVDERWAEKVRAAASGLERSS